MSPKFREILYYVGTIVPGVLGLFLIFGGIDQGAADNLNSIVAGVVSMLGAAAPATAAVKVGQQRKDGTFTSLSPAEQVVAGVTAVVTAQQTAQAELQKVQAAVAGAVSTVPALGPLAAQIINGIPNAVPSFGIGDFSNFAHP